MGGYECTGCGKMFHYEDFDPKWKALEAGQRHIEEDHNTLNELERF